MPTAQGAAGAVADELDLLDNDLSREESKPVPKVSEIPDKYKGKSVEEIINMHQNAEALATRQGAELGQLRRLTDEVLNLKKPETQKTEERKPVTVNDILNDPEKAIRDAVASSEGVRRAEAAEARVSKLESDLSEQSFVTKHTNFAKDINDPDFVAWVNKNPLRQALATRVAQKDFTAATNLWDMWDEYKELSGKKETTTNNDNKQNGRKVPTTVKTAPADGNKSKQIWSRAKLMELREQVNRGVPAALARWNDPGFQDRMHAAYAEERVK